MNFTKNKEINEKINQNISKLVKKITEENQNVLSIYLIGSLARKESFWRVSEESKLVSDIDLFIVTSKGKISGDYADYRVVSLEKLKRIPEDTHNYDVIKTKILLWGKDISKKFPKISKWKFGIEDIKLLFFNRLYLNLISKKDSKSRKACKTMFTVTDMLSILLNKYDPSFLKRRKNAEKSFKKYDFPKEFSSDLKKCYNFWFKENKKTKIDNEAEIFKRIETYLFKAFEIAMEKYTGNKYYTRYKEKKYFSTYSCLKLFKKGFLMKFWRTDSRKNARMAIYLESKGKREDSIRYLSRIIFYPKIKNPVEFLKKVHGIVF